MTKTCEFYNKTQSSRKIFGQIFNIDLRVKSDKRLDEIFAEPFRVLTADWMPSAIMADLEFLTKTVTNIMKDERFNNSLTQAFQERALNLRWS